jgi:hypothetical protein
MNNMINAVPTDTNDPYFTDDLIDDQEYPSNDQGRVMEPNRGGGEVNGDENIVVVQDEEINEDQKEEDETWGDENAEKTAMLPIQNLSS